MLGYGYGRALGIGAVMELAGLPREFFVVSEHETDGPPGYTGPTRYTRYSSLMTREEATTRAQAMVEDEGALEAVIGRYEGGFKRRHLSQAVSLEDLQTAYGESSQAANVNKSNAQAAEDAAAQQADVQAMNAHMQTPGWNAPAGTAQDPPAAAAPPADEADHAAGNCAEGIDPAAAPRRLDGEEFRPQPAFGGGGHSFGGGW